MTGISMKDIGYDISDMKIYADDTMTVEVDTSDWTPEQWATILGGVPIVRCKDCKWWHRLDDSPIGYCHACKHGYYSDKWEISIRRTYKEDFYCADGERKNRDE